jgi:glycerophosphoryl diester phosphodiesterase
VQFLEVDVRKGGDGTLFIFHDGSLQEGNFSSPLDLTGKRVQELTQAERERVRLDQGGVVHIPTLKEALDVVSQNKTTTLQIDLKGESDELLQSVIDLLKQEKKLSRAVIQLKSPERIARIRAAEPAARILARCKDMAQLDQAIAAQVEFIELERWITAEAIAKCHAANITVVLNVAAPQYDKRETWEFFRARGVDSVMTDHAVLAK